MNTSTSGKKHFGEYDELKNIETSDRDMPSRHAEKTPTAEAKKVDMGKPS